MIVATVTIIYIVTSGKTYSWRKMNKTAYFGNTPINLKQYCDISLALYLFGQRVENFWRVMRDAPLQLFCHLTLFRVITLLQLTPNIGRNCCGYKIVLGALIWEDIVAYRRPIYIVSGVNVPFYFRL